MADNPSTPPAGGPIAPPAADIEPQYSPETDFLLHIQELILDGRSVYGDPTGRRAQEKLAEIGAKLAFRRSLGDAPPEPEPWTPARAAREQLAREFPDPAATSWHPAQQEFVAKQVGALGSLETRQQADLHQALVDDLGNRMTPATARYSLAKNGVYPRGSEILEALLKDAEPAILARMPAEHRQNMRDVLKLDRGLLERFAVDGRNISGYRVAATRYGVK